MEASTFGSDFQALKNAVELIESLLLRYELRMFGVPIGGASNVFCDNGAVYKNISLPESTLKKTKHHFDSISSVPRSGCRRHDASG